MRAFVAALLVFASSVIARPRIHAHNDYEHPHPLFDALAAGARSVEADIYLVNGQLLVAHNFLELQKGRTLKSLYLDPLRQRIAQHNGSVYGDGETLFLLIDLKQDGKSQSPVLRAQLEPYKDLLTSYGNEKKPGPISVILTGNQPLRKALADEPHRLVACDGSLKDLTTNPPVDLVPLISGSWSKSFTWDGTGQMPGDQRDRLAEIVRLAHAQGRTVRFWGGPDNQAFWEQTTDIGVDWINTDHLAQARAFLEQRYSHNSSTLPSGKTTSPFTPLSRMVSR